MLGRQEEEVKIVINKWSDKEFLISIEDGDGDRVNIDDEAHSNITSESEALARAKALRSATGWEISKEYES